MPSLIDLLLAYGLCFGLMNKVDFLHKKHPLLDELLKCSYCMGFHAGWLAWLVTFPLHSHAALTVLLWSLSGAAFCYTLDTMLQLAESWVRKDNDNG